MNRENSVQEEQNQREAIRETGEVKLSHRIHLISVIGEIEGHECLPGNSKTTKYEHLLPKLAAIEDSSEIDGLLILLNTVGGDVDAGPCHRGDDRFPQQAHCISGAGRQPFHRRPHCGVYRLFLLVKTGTMVVHPVRMNGTVIGAPQTYDYFRQMQDRILGFIAAHSGRLPERLEELMLDTGMLTKDLGTILVGEDAVREGLIDEVGGIREA